MYGGLPSVIFEPSYSDAEFEAFIRTAVDAAEKGGIVLGMGDNVPPASDFARIRRIQELVEGRRRP
jgi:hypothetical protein